MTKKEWALLEFEKAVRHTKEHLALVLTPYSAAGWCLRSAGLDIDEAILICRGYEGTWWSSVLAVLTAIKNEKE